MSNYRITKKMDDGVIIELDRYRTFDWIYFSSGGLDIGIDRELGDKVMHRIPVAPNTERVRIKITVLAEDDEGSD